MASLLVPHFHYQPFSRVQLYPYNNHPTSAIHDARVARQLVGARCCQARPGPAARLSPSHCWRHTSTRDGLGARLPSNAQLAQQKQVVTTERSRRGACKWAGAHLGRRPAPKTHFLDFRPPPSFEGPSLPPLSGYLRTAITIIRSPEGQMKCFRRLRYVARNCILLVYCLLCPPSPTLLLP